MKGMLEFGGRLATSSYQMMIAFFMPSPVLSTMLSPSGNN